MENQTVNQHKSKEAVLFCNVTGNPYPKVTWLRNGIPTGATLVRESCVGQKYGYYYKNKEHTELVICDRTYLDSGFYTCAVENSVGKDSKDVFLNVTSKFKASFFVLFCSNVHYFLLSCFISTFHFYCNV